MSRISRWDALPTPSFVPWLQATALYVRVCTHDLLNDIAAACSVRSHILDHMAYGQLANAPESTLNLQEHEHKMMQKSPMHEQELYCLHIYIHHVYHVAILDISALSATWPIGHSGIKTKYTRNLRCRSASPQRNLLILSTWKQEGQQAPANGS